MASNLRVDSIVPTTSGNVSIGTATGGVTIPGNLGIAGVLTYEDVTNIDSVGVITARSGINVTSGNIALSSNGANVSPSGFDFKIRSNTAKLGIHIDNADGTPTLDFGIGGPQGADITTNSTGPIVFKPNNSERLRITHNGEIGIGGANYGTSGQVLKSQGSGSAVQWATPSLAMADQWRVSTSQSTSAHTVADITAWSRNNNNFAGVGSALTNSGADFTFPSTGIYYISYNIATYITTGSARYISARLYYNGQDVCHSWASAHHGASSGQTLMSTGSQAIIDVPNTSYTFKIRLQSSVPVTIVGLNEAGYNSSVNMSEVVVMRIGDT